MWNSLIKYMLSLGCCIALCTSAKCQKGPEIGGYIAGSQYFGDLNTQFSIDEPGYGLGFIYRHNYNDRISAKATLSHVFLRSDDSNSTNIFEFVRNANFHSRIWELAISGEFNFFSFIHGRDDFNFTPYLTGGAAYIMYNSTGIVDGQRIDLSTRDIEQANYSSHTPAFYLGGGIKYSLNHKWVLNVELSYRYALTDYIDDVSTFNPITLVQRGNSKDNDRYALLQIGILRYFGTLQCPAISKPNPKKKKKRKKS